MAPDAPPPSDGMRWAHWPYGAPGRPLTSRQRQVIGLAARGLSHSEIAGQLGITPETVRNHLSCAFGRLQVPMRPGSRERTLVAALNVLGMIHVPDEYRCHPEG